MAADTKITPSRLKRLVALLDSGESLRSVASSLDVSHSTVLRWMQERGLEAKGRPGAKRKAERAPKIPPAPAQITPVELAAEVARAEAALGERGASRELLRKELAAITVQLAHTREAMVRGDSSGAVYERLSKLQRDYARELQSLEPPPEKDPERDPSNIEAADRTLAKFRKLVMRSEAETRCQHCGRAPF